MLAEPCALIMGIRPVRWWRWEGKVGGRITVAYNRSRDEPPCLFDVQSSIYVDAEV